MYDEAVEAVDRTDRMVLANTAVNGEELVRMMTR